MLLMMLLLFVSIFGLEHHAVESDLERQIVEAQGAVIGAQRNLNKLVVAAMFHQHSSPGAPGQFSSQRRKLQQSVTKTTRISAGSLTLGSVVLSAHGEALDTLHLNATKSIINGQLYLNGSDVATRLTDIEQSLAGNAPCWCTAAASPDDYNNYWAFDEGEGYLTYDSACSSCTTGIFSIEGISWIDRGEGYALSFDAAGMLSVDVVDTWLADIAVEFSVSLWLRNVGIGWDGAITIMTRSDTAWNLGFYNADVFFNINGGKCESNSDVMTSYSLSEWTHLAVSHNSSSSVTTFFVNGQAGSWHSSACKGIRVPVSDAVLEIGQDVVGDLDDITVWPYALTAFDVSLAMHATNI